MTATLDRIASRRVLVVDDSPVQCTHIGDLCRQIGVQQIVQCHGGNEALMCSLEMPAAPDIVIVDLEMPDMDGIALLQAMVRHNLLAEAGVIVASGRENNLLTSVEALCRTMGIHLLGVLAKPVSLMDLLRALAHHEEPAPPAARAAVPRYSLHDLEQALHAHEFVPYFQPKVTLTTAALAGVETLIRWRHPEHGIVAPGCFIGLLERSP